MAAPSPAQILEDPPALVPTLWPYRVEPFPADDLFGQLGPFLPLPDVPKP